MKTKFDLLPMVLFILICSCLVSCTKVDEKMITFAKELATRTYKEQPRFGFTLHPVIVTINKIEVVEIGKKNNNMLPVKFHIQGVIKTKEDKADASSFPIRLSLVDVTEPINDTVVYYFSKDEFNKQVVCDESQMICNKEK
jgi:hypothetical protein